MGVRTNYAPNPSFESAVTNGWNVNHSHVVGAVTYAQVADPYVGSQAASFACTADATDTVGYCSLDTDSTPVGTGVVGDYWTLSVYIKKGSGTNSGVTINIRISELGAAGNYLSTHMGPDFEAVLTTDYQRFDITALLTNAAVSRVQGYIFCGHIASGDACDIVADCALLEKTDTLLPYFSGSTSDTTERTYAWEGTTDDSLSTETIADSVTVVTYGHAQTTTWTCPPRVPWLDVELWGGGGGGGAGHASTNGGSGGGGGAYARSLIPTPAAGVYNLAVGAGGTGGAAGGANNGTAGENSWFYSYYAYLAQGGSAGLYNSTAAVLGGDAATSSGDRTYSGGDGAAATASQGGGGGGGADRSGDGSAGSGTTAGTTTGLIGGAGGAGSAGWDGAAAVSGYGGGGGGGDDTARGGGAGKCGFVRLTYDTEFSGLSVSAFPGTAGTAASSPYDDNDWADVNNVKLDDASWASITASSFDANDYSYLVQASNFGLAIPAQASIQGIVVECNAYFGVGRGRWAMVQLLDADGAAVGDNNAADGGYLFSHQAAGVFGGARNNWGTTLTPALVNDADFGVQLAVQALDDNSTAYIDYVKVTVFYTHGQIFSTMKGLW